MAISVVVLFAAAAFALDFGMMYQERRELQVGADAAALALASECAFGDCINGFDPYSEAEVYADGNARDGLASVQNIDLDLASQQVTVKTQTEDQDGDNFLELMFAPVVGYDGVTVTAQATVAWGSPGGLETLPLIFSMCEWQTYGSSGFVDESAGGYLHRAENEDLLPPTAGYPWADRVAEILFHGTSVCHYNPSGQDLPGGFGWLETTGVCEADIDVGTWVRVDPGASPSNGCTAALMRSLMGEVVLIPYFDDYRSVGTNAEYHVAGFGALYITGYNFGGGYKEQSLIDGQAPCKGDDRCIQGYFIGDYQATGGELGGPDLGVIVVQFVG